MGTNYEGSTVSYLCDMEGGGCLPSMVDWALVKSVTFTAAPTHVKQLKYEVSKEATQHTLGEQL